MENLRMEHDKCKDLLGNAKHIESWKEETETMNQYVQLEQQLKRCEGLKDDVNEHDKISSKDVEMQSKACGNCCSPNAKDRHILALERQVTVLKNSSRNRASTTESSEKDNNDEKMNGKARESWKQEIETKNRHIVELEQKIASLESELQKNLDAQRMRDLEKRIHRKSKRIVELEDAVEELEDFLKEDVKEMRDLRYQVSLDKEHIIKMEKWIQKNNLTNAGIDKARIIQLEEMVTSLEDYVREHDIDGLKRKLQDREYRIVQLESQISEPKKLSKFEENKAGKDMPKESVLFDNEVACELEEKEHKTKDVISDLKETNKIQEYEQEESLKIELREKEQKMKEMAHDISEKDNRIQRYEQQIVEQQNKILKMEKEMAEMEEELYETEDINALKEEIRLRNERVQELEMEVNSLETSLSERIDAAIEDLIITLKEKEEIELQLKKDLTDKERKLEELDAALRQSIAITDEIETKFKHEKKLRKEADQRIVEEKIAIMQAVLTAKCSTCKPFLSKIFKTEEFIQSNQEKTFQLQELHQIKREALKAALSEKDSHLALLEHSGIKTPTQVDQAAKLKADKKILLDRLREEDEKSIKLDFKRETTSQLFQKIFKITDSNEDGSDNNNNSFGDRFSRINSPKSVAVNGDSSPTSAATSCKYSTRTSMVSDLKDEDQSQIHQQDTR